MNEVNLVTLQNTQTSGLGNVQTAGNEKMDPIFSERLSAANASQETGADQQKVNDYTKFKSLVKDSPIGKKFLTANDAARLGFKPKPGMTLIKDANGKLKSVPDPSSQMMDMNGGLYYENKKTGETLRICEFENSLEYTKGNMTQHQWFDQNGKPSGGLLTIKDPRTGKITEYKYENDIDGNQFVVGVKVTSEEK